MFEVLFDTKEAANKMLTTGAVFRIKYNLFDKRFQLYKSSSCFIKPEVREWLHENIGQESQCVRELDQAFYDLNDIPVPYDTYREYRISSYEEWNNINPIIPKERLQWRVTGDYQRKATIIFKNPQDAVMFKLAWF